MMDDDDDALTSVDDAMSRMTSDDVPTLETTLTSMDEDDL